MEVNLTAAQVVNMPEIQELIRQAVEKQVAEKIKEMEERDKEKDKKIEELVAIIKSRKGETSQANETPTAMIEKMTTYDKKADEATVKINDINAAIQYLYENGLQGEKELYSAIREVGKKQTNSRDIVVYGIENNGVFLHNDKGDREFVELQDKLLEKAIKSKETIIDNDFNGKFFAGEEAKNIMLCPMTNSKGDVIAIVAAKNKTNEKGDICSFSEEDAKKFDPKANGSGIGAMIHASLENTYNESTAAYYKKIATHDHLLKDVYNRNGAEEQLKTTVYDAIKEGKSVCFALADIDKFKKFNDTYGHDKGDEVLKIVADKMQSVVRKDEGFVFRFGGEEIGMVLLLGEKDSYTVADRARQIVEKTPLHVERNGTEEDVGITISIGMTAFDLGTDDLTRDDIWEAFNDIVFKAADERLYEAKEDGRNRVYSSDMLPHTSPSEVFREYLKKLDISLIPSGNDSYLLYDNVYNSICEDNIRTPQEAVNAVKSWESEVICSLRNITDEIGLKNVPKSDDVKEWEDFVRKAARNPNNRELIGKAAPELLIINSLADQADKIHLDLVADIVAESPAKDKEVPNKPSNKAEAADTQPSKKSNKGGEIDSR